MDSSDPEYRAIIDSLRGDGHYSGRPPLPPSPKRGNGDDMEPRLARLEAHMESVRADLTKMSSLPVDMATLKTKVEHLPTKGFIITAVTTTLVIVAALSTFVQWVLAANAGAGVTHP